MHIEIVRNIVQPEKSKKSYYYREPLYSRTSAYCEAMSNLCTETFSEDDVQFFKELYLATKDIATRNTIMKAFILQCTQHDLKDFFLFSQER
jgi:hypothetical protein